MEGIGTSASRVGRIALSASARAFSGIATTLQ